MNNSNARPRISRERSNKRARSEPIYKICIGSEHAINLAAMTVGIDIKVTFIADGEQLGLELFDVGGPGRAEVHITLPCLLRPGNWQPHTPQPPWAARQLSSTAHTEAIYFVVNWQRKFSPSWNTFRFHICCYHVTFSGRYISNSVQRYCFLYWTISPLLFVDKWVTFWSGV